MGIRCVSKCVLCILVDLVYREMGSLFTWLPVLEVTRTMTLVRLSYRG